MSRILPLTVLVQEGPQARAYLAAMARTGFQPSRILLMVETHHPVTGKPRARFLPRPLRMRYAAKSQELTRNFWPRRLRAASPHLVDRMTAEMSKMVPGASEIVEVILGKIRYEDYAERVERVPVRDLRDPKLAEALAGLGPGAVLFTGGGILRANLLALPGVRFLHVHPGFLPHVRGADGFLWSTLVRGRPGASCFYMASGIDTGEIVASVEYPPLSFDLGAHTRPPAEMLYRALFSFCDPLLRAQLWVEHVLGKGDDLCRLPVAEQDREAGLTYHFLHPALREKALALVFPTANE